MQLLAKFKKILYMGFRATYHLDLRHGCMVIYLPTFTAPSPDYHLVSFRYAISTTNWMDALKRAQMN